MYSGRKRPQSSLSSSQSLSTTATDLSALVFPPPISPQSYLPHVQHSSRAAVTASSLVLVPSPRASPRVARTIVRASRQSSRSQNSLSASLREENISAEPLLPNACSPAASLLRVLHWRPLCHLRQLDPLTNSSDRPFSVPPSARDNPPPLPSLPQPPRLVYP